MSNLQSNFWIGAIAGVVAASLAMWIYSASQAVPGIANSTGAETATSTTGSVDGAAQGVPFARRASNVASIAEHLSGASTFASWFTSTGIAAKVVGKGPYTIFVPTNGSISLLPAGTWSALSAAGRVRLVEDHVVKGRAIDAEAEVAGTIQTMSGDYINFNYGADNIPMVGNAIIIAEYRGSNGIVYLIDNVLLPPKK